uniref:Uncharacterized protein n=1 Tax=Arundo donax TaxID=35708 RepID=A0A0A9F2A5_ARUDO
MEVFKLLFLEQQKDSIQHRKTML